MHVIVLGPHALDVHRFAGGALLGAAGALVLWHLTAVVWLHFRLWRLVRGRRVWRGRWRTAWDTRRGCTVGYAQGDSDVHGPVVYLFTSWRWWRFSYIGEAVDFQRRNVQHGTERMSRWWRRWVAFSCTPEELHDVQNETIVRLNPRQNIHRPGLEERAA